MKKLFFNAKTALILLIIAALSLGFLIYFAKRPISYGMSYTNTTEYDGGVFEGTLVFTRDGKQIITNSNLDESIETRYYYKDGYVFFLTATTDEEYDAEVAKICSDIEAAKNAPFYADEISAFRMIATEGDGYETVYTCDSAIAIAKALSALLVVSAGLAFVCVLFKKRKHK